MPEFNATTSTSSFKSNLLLAALPETDLQRLVPHLKPRLFHLGQNLFEPEEMVNQVYLLKSGTISCVILSQTGVQAEVGLVGFEGIVGASEVLGGAPSTLRAMVQAAGSGWQLPAPVFKTEFERWGIFQKLVLAHQHAFSMQIAQAVVCNRLHLIEARLSRWLLMIHDRVPLDELELTQEFIAAMLCSRRPGVTMAAGALREAGLIDYQRGTITILNRKGLENAACECYGALHKRNLVLMERFQEIADEN